MARTNRRRSRHDGRGLGTGSGAARGRLTLEQLEGRQVLAAFVAAETYVVNTLADSGPGSLRQAIIDANVHKGADAIDFSVAGTIALKSALPAVTGSLDLDGSSAPGYAGKPVVTLDFQNNAGLIISAGADGSVIKSLSLVDSSGAGVSLAASGVTVAGNYIGLRADGSTIESNRGDGVAILAGSHDNLIGNDDPVKAIQYFTPAGMSLQPVKGIQGLRGGNRPGEYLMSGTTGNNGDGLLFVGPITATGGKSYPVRVPGAMSTSVYGPDNLGGNRVRLVGSSINSGSDTRHGFLFEGTTTDLTNGTGTYTTIDVAGATFTYVHSTMGGLAVGNADGPTVGAPEGTGQAFIYDVAKKQIIGNIRFPESVSNTAYGIWHNGGTNYTICGGFSQLSINNGGDQNQPIGQGYLVDYDSSTGQFSHWKALNYPKGIDVVTHFEGISSTEAGVYTLAASSVHTGSALPGSFVTVRRNADGAFSDGVWVDLAYPGSAATLTTSVSGSALTGVGIGGSGGMQWFQATVDIGFQLSNVISGNRGAGVSITGAGATNNHVAMNFIGTDVTGTLRRGNGGNGVVITAGATGNLIGGEATGGNDPTKGVFVRPPQGNLISGNYANGVLISEGAESNQLSGNYVGTTVSGLAPLGNTLDGVAIVGADNNSLLGTTLNQNPFVFYNVLSGNGGNGLRITDSNDTTVYANFMGLGRDNKTPVPNGGNGLLVSGNSQGVTLGGVIPLGNVISGNKGNGIEIRDTVSGVNSWNSFVGMVAFGGAAANGKNGILITSTNPAFEINHQQTWNIIRTSLIGGNVGNGIEIAGNASGVQITDTAIGTNWNIMRPLANGGSGIVVGGTAHNIALGGFQPSIEQLDTTASVHLGGNKGYGLEIRDLAYDVTVFNTVVGAGVGLIGPSIRKAIKLPNGKGGIAIGPGVSDVAIGSGLSVPNGYSAAVAYNNGVGITIEGARNVSVEGTKVESNAKGGIQIKGGTNVLIGTETSPNSISGNTGFGVSASGTLTGSAVSGNLITRNTGNGVRLQAAQGLLVGGTANGSGNTITRNQAFGLFALGDCSGSTVEGNTIERNGAGNTNVAKSSGLVVVDYSLILGPYESVTGVRGASGKKVVLVGSYKPENSSVLIGQWWVGDLTTGVGKAVQVNPTFSGQTVTASLYYGPNTAAFNPALGKDNIRVVGTYKYSESAVDGQHGVIYQGPANGVGGTWTQMNVPSSIAGGTVLNTIPHSTMGNLVVGNYDLVGQPVGSGNAFIYDISTGQYQVFDSSWGGVTELTSAYGIWQNGGPKSTLYTIVGGSKHEGANTAYMVDYDSATKTFSHKTFFPLGTETKGDTHFEGINAAPGGYTLSGTILSGGAADAAYAYVPVNRDGSFGAAQWVPLHYPGSSFCSGDTVYQNVEMGICMLPNPLYQADPTLPATVERTYKATVTVTGGAAGGANISIPIARQGFVGAAAGAQRLAQYAPTQVTSPVQLNQPIGQEKADEIARALGLDKSKCFTEEQYLKFISGQGVNGSGDPQQAALVDESVNLLTNSAVNPLHREINGTPTQIVLGSYGLAVSKDGVWLDSLANSAEPTRRVNEVIAPGGYMDTWAAANGATASLEMLRKSAYTVQLPYGIVAQHEGGAAELDLYRNGFKSAAVGLSMTPPLWEVNFCLIYMLNPKLAANMPAQWNPIPAEVATALLKGPSGRVRFSDFASYFPPECVVANPG